MNSLTLRRLAFTLVALSSSLLAQVSVPWADVDKTGAAPSDVGAQPLNANLTALSAHAPSYYTDAANFTGNIAAPRVTSLIGSTLQAWSAALDTFAANGPSYYAPVNSPAFTGTPAAPTPGNGDVSTKIATTAFVNGVLGGSGAWGYNTPTTISAAGDTTLALGVGQHDRQQAVTVSAGSAPYDATLTLTSTNASAGDRQTVRVTMPESLNPRIKIQNLTSGGSTLAFVPATRWTSVWTGMFGFDGTNWKLLNYEVPQHTSQGGVARDSLRTANLAAFIHAQATRSLVYELPKLTRNKVLITSADYIPSVGAWNSDTTWTYSSPRYFHRDIPTYGASRIITLPVIGTNTAGGETPAGTKFLGVYYLDGGNNTVTFKNSDGSTVFTEFQASNAAAYWIELTAGASAWTAATYGRSVNTYALTSSVFTHLGCVPTTYASLFLQEATAHQASWRIRFRCDSNRFIMRMHRAGATVEVIADGERYGQFSLSSDGQDGWQIFNFVDAREREIEITAYSSFQPGAVTVLESGKSIMASNRAVPAKRLIWMADSVGEQRAGAGTSICEFAATQLGMEPWNTPLGSTGYLNDGLYVRFETRFDTDVLPYARTGDTLVLAGGINDYGSDATAFAAAFNSLLTHADSVLPSGMTKVVLGPWWPRSSDPVMEATAAIMQTQTATHAGWIFIDQSMWIHGRMDAPIVQGTAQLEIADGTHPTLAGLRTEATRFVYQYLIATSQINPVLQ